MRNKHVLHMVQAALIAAMYVVLTWVANLLRLANGVIQVRFSEALTILPFFTPAAIPGLFRKISIIPITKAIRSNVSSTDKYIIPICLCVFSTNVVIIV